MSLSAAVVLELAQRCAPAVAAQTLSAVAWTESRFNPLAIHVNRGGPQVAPPTSRVEALAAATALQAAGANFDLGLLQINVANLRRLDLTLEQAFDPCRSLAAGAAVLHADYATARGKAPAPQAALRTALSRYNTGDDARGFANGYVTRVVQAAAHLAGASIPATPPLSTTPPPSAWDAFGDLKAAGFVIRLPANQGPTS